MNTEIDNFPVSELQSRFGIGKQATYNRLLALNIKPFKEGNRSYITADQLRLLDALHAHIIAGGTMADFSLLPRGRQSTGQGGQSTGYSGQAQSADSNSQLL